MVHNGVELEGCLLIDVMCGGLLGGLGAVEREEGVGRGFEVEMGGGEGLILRIRPLWWVGPVC